MRKVEVIAGPRKFTSDDFTIYFDIPFDDGPDVNIAEIEIYNLSDNTIAAIKKGHGVIINAGYQNDVGAVLTGVTQRIETNWEDVDKTTSLMVADAHDNWMEVDVKRTYKEGITAQQILNDLIPYTGLRVGALNLPLNMRYDGAKTIDGKIGKIIVEIAKDCNAKVHVNKGKIFIREKSEGDKIAFVLDKNHGLVGSPTPIENEEKYNVAEKVKKGDKWVDGYVSKSRIRRGFKVVSLLNHNFTTDVIVKIISKTANGFYRIEKGKHVSSGSNFYTEVEVYPI